MTTSPATAVPGPRRGRRRDVAAILLAALLLAACGSTVPLAGEVTLRGDAAGQPDGLGAVGPLQEGSVPAATGGGAPGVLGEPGQQTDPSEPAAAGEAAGGPVAPSGGGPSGPAPARTSGAAPPAATGTGPVTVGFLVSKDLGAVTKALGVDGLATGNGRRQAEAAVELANDRGGIAGRPIRSVVFEFDPSGNAENQFQAACSRFFEDNKAQAVVSVILNELLSACTERRGAVLVNSGNRSPSSGFLDRFAHTVVPSQIPLEKLIALQVQGLSRQGWFRPASAGEEVKVGLLYADTTDFTGVPARAASALRQVGLSLALSQEMPVVDDSSRVGTASSAGSNAVLRFRGAGITRVLVVDKSGQALTYFGMAAQNQGYFPRYGVSSLELPSLLRLVLSARQLEGASGVGFAPLYDVPLRAQPPANESIRACLGAMQGAQEDMQSSGTRASALTICDGALLLAAAGKAGGVSRSGFLAGLQVLGRTYAPVMTPTVDFALGRAPASGFRDLRFSAGCDCFEYVGAVQRVS